MAPGGFAVVSVILNIGTSWKVAERYEEAIGAAKRWRDGLEITAVGSQIAGSGNQPSVIK